MDNKNNNRRRRPGESVKRAPQKAPHAKPRKNPPPVQEPERVAPEVVYLAPKPFRRSRLILHLATVAAVVLALMLGLSVFFKVERIEVSGCSQYTAWQVQQASGISEGDQLLTISVPRASGKIINALPYVKTARIGISLPNTVKIEIVETRVTYALQARNGSWWLMDSDGKIIEQCAAGTEKDHTVIYGVTLDNPVVGTQAVAYQDSTAATDAEGNTVPVTVKAELKLSAVTQIAGYLEQNGFIGDVASLDVSNFYEIQLWYGDRFQVRLGDTDEMSTKIRYLKGFVDDYTKNRPYESGLLDLTDPDWIEYQSFLEDQE